MPKVIRVITMEDCPIGNRAAEVCAKPTVSSHHEAKTSDSALLIKSYGVAIEKRMTLSRDHEIVITIEPQFYWA